MRPDGIIDEAKRLLRPFSISEHEQKAMDMLSNLGGVEIGSLDKIIAGYMRAEMALECMRLERKTVY